MDRNPLSEADKINKRSVVIQYFQSREIGFYFQYEWFDEIEYYLGNSDDRLRFARMHGSGGLLQKQ